MSGYGHRKAAVLVDATAWRDRVIDDARRDGRDAARGYELSTDIVIAAAEIIAAYMAAGKRSARRSGYAIGTLQEQRVSGTMCK
jgi:hypothetical protein